MGDLTKLGFFGVFFVISVNGNSAWDFFFFFEGGGGLLQALGILGGFSFCSHSIIPIT